jgi:mRNA interferase RelE/StbE
VNDTPIWRVEFDPDALRDLRKIGGSARAAILRYLRERIATKEDPRRFGHALLGDLRGLWRYRVGDYRIIADIKDEKILVVVVAVGHRHEVYD